MSSAPSATSYPWPAAYGVTRRPRPWEMDQRALRAVLGRARYERVMFRRHMGRWPNYAHPSGLAEKASWRKLYQDLPNAVLVSDRVAVRDYVRDTVGARYLNDALLVADAGDPIDLDRLPPRFAAKASHGSGLNLFVLDASRVDPAAVRRRLAANLRVRYGHLSNEWWYEQITPRILIEPLLWEEENGFPVDFKAHVYGGDHVVWTVHWGRHQGGPRDSSLYDDGWRHVSSSRDDRAVEPPPPFLAEMREVAVALAAGMDFMRVDFFSPDRRHPVFGEITLAPGAGWNRLRGEEVDAFLGSFWILPGAGSTDA